MRKPIVLFSFKGIPTREDSETISRKIRELSINEEYHTLIIFDCEETKVELLCKGRHHKTIKNLLKL